MFSSCASVGCSGPKRPEAQELKPTALAPGPDPPPPATPRHAGGLNNERIDDGFAPDYMRRNQRMLGIVAAMVAAAKPVAAICHGPWMLCSARDALDGGGGARGGGVAGPGGALERGASIIALTLSMMRSSMVALLACQFPERWRGAN